MLPYRTACHVYPFAQRLLTPHPWVGSTLGTASYSEMDPWCPLLSVPRLSSVCYSLAVGWGVLLQSTQGHIRSHITHPVHFPQPAKLLQSSHEHWEKVVWATVTPFQTLESHITQLMDIPTVPGKMTEPELGLGHWTWCRSCSLPQSKGRASCTNQGTSVIGTFQPRSSDISS